MSAELVELRAERLRVAIQVLDIKDDFSRLYPEPRPLLSKHDLALALTLSSCDRALAHACLGVVRDMRRREWEALAHLLGAIPPGGNLEDIYDLPAEQAIPALRAAAAIGWLREGRE